MMAKATVGKDREVIIPPEVLDALGVQEGDEVVFDRVNGGFELRRKRRLDEFFASLPAKRPWPGKEAVYDEVGRALGRELDEQLT